MTALLTIATIGLPGHLCSSIESLPFDHNLPFPRIPCPWQQSFPLCFYELNSQSSPISDSMLLILPSFLKDQSNVFFYLDLSAVFPSSHLPFFKYFTFYKNDYFPGDRLNTWIYNLSFLRSQRKNYRKKNTKRNTTMTTNKDFHKFQKCGKQNLFHLSISFKISLELPVSSK
jgi:hypothetical protein